MGSLSWWRDYWLFRISILSEIDTYHLGSLTLMSPRQSRPLLASLAAPLLFGVCAYGDTPVSVQGPGDYREGYAEKEFRTRSTSLEARRGVQADLLNVLQSPPLGLPAIPVPRDNPVTEVKVRLGRKLFFDRRLSANNTISCAMWETLACRS